MQLHTPVWGIFYDVFYFIIILLLLFLFFASVAQMSILEPRYINI